MALTSNKATQITGYSVIEGQNVVYFSANVSDESVGNTTVSQSILNSELYAQNRVECRADSMDFQELVWATEDEFINSQNSSTESAE